MTETATKQNTPEPPDPENVRMEQERWRRRREQVFHEFLEPIRLAERQVSRRLDSLVDSQQLRGVLLAKARDALMEAEHAYRRQWSDFPPKRPSPPEPTPPITGEAA